MQGAGARCEACPQRVRAPICTPFCAHAPPLHTPLFVRAPAGTRGGRCPGPGRAAGPAHPPGFAAERQQQRGAGRVRLACCPHHVAAGGVLLLRMMLHHAALPLHWCCCCWPPLRCAVPCRTFGVNCLARARSSLNSMYLRARACGSFRGWRWAHACTCSCGHVYATCAPVPCVLPAKWPCASAGAPLRPFKQHPSPTRCRRGPAW